MSGGKGRGTRTKIGILGYTEHRNQAPFNDPAWEWWGLNDLYTMLPPHLQPEQMRWFQLHAWRDNPNPVTPSNLAIGPPAHTDQSHIRWLQHWSKPAQGLTLYTLRPHPELPDANVLPQDQIFDYFGRNYFTNTITFMIGWAIMALDPKGTGSPTTPAVKDATIGIWGVDMMVSGGPGSEYGWQRPSCEWLIGRAEGQGITVTIPDESDLCKTAFAYGDREGNMFRKKLTHTRNVYSQRRGNVDGQANQLSHARAELSGAINVLDHIIGAWMPADGPMSNGGAPHPQSHQLTMQGGETGRPVDPPLEVKDLDDGKAESNHGVRPVTVND